MASVIDVKGNATDKQVELPQVFSTPLRPDIVSRAFRVLRSHGLQPYGRDPMAGERTSAESGWPPTGRGISRVPRVKGERSRRSGQAAGVASVVGGRLAHPPKSEKSIYLKMNKKERALALKTAIAFTGDSDAVAWRGHRTGPLEFPLVVDDGIETVTKTAELLSFLRGAGLEDELNRLYDGVKRRSGKPRMRGRAYKERVGPLFVVSSDRGIGRAAESIPGVRVVQANSLSILDLAPAGVAGRMTFWTESALENFRSEAPGTGNSRQEKGRSEAEQGGMKVEA